MQPGNSNFTRGGTAEELSRGQRKASVVVLNFITLSSSEGAVQCLEYLPLLVSIMFNMDFRPDMS